MSTGVFSKVEVIELFETGATFVADAN